MIKFLMDYPKKIYIPLLQHIQLTLVTIIISLIIAVIISAFIIKSRILSQLVISAFGAVYSIPSLALFVLLVPLIGLGQKTAIIVLIVYNQFILIRNIVAGFNSIDPAVIEAAEGMGMSYYQVLYRIKFPLAAPVIIAGIKIAVTTTIGIGTIAATINAGGLGVLLFDGLRTQNTVKILWGAILSASLAITAGFILERLEKRIRLVVNGSIEVK